MMGDSEKMRYPSQDDTSSQSILFGRRDSRPQTCLHHLFELAAAKHADKTALICGTTTLTYSDVNARANRLARALARRGLTHGQLVAVAMDRSPELVVVLLAVAKTGGVYVPIDPALPSARIEQMMEDARPSLLVCTRLTSTFDIWRDISVTVDELRDEVSNDDRTNPHFPVEADSLLYVMYTSGSTGRPKGVEISHGNVSNLLLSMQSEPGFDEGDRLLALTTVSFDMAVPELFLPLVSGGTVLIAQRHELRDAGALLFLMRTHNVTVVQGTPATWQMLLDAGWQSEDKLRKIFCGGEAMTRALADRLVLRADEVWNLYGPTETTVYGSLWRVRPGVEVAVGRPPTNGSLYILDEDMKPVPSGDRGELYIGGQGVARGYRNNEELTERHFVSDPFCTGQMYRTGDYARLAGDEIIVLGRMDGQVKIRGNRVELGDVEAAIAAHNEISSAVVVCRDDRLAAYCVRIRDASTTAEELGPMLRNLLSKRLPEYMVPAFFVEMDALPVTMNGKIDRKTLPDPVLALQPRVTLTGCDELEARLLSIWARVLGHDRFGIHDNFFEIGGDSLRLIRVQGELARHGTTVSAPELFEHYTIDTLTAHLRTPSAKHTESAEGGSQVDEDIAIISMACRLPGDVASPDDFWALLDGGGDAITEVPAGRWKPDKGEFCRRGGFLSSVHAYDASFFGISPREARSLDPSQYALLEASWEALERAGFTKEALRGSQTGVFAGTSSIPAYAPLDPQTKIMTTDDVDGYTATGSAGATLSGRIAYQLGLEGPAMTIDTACSSSLVATHLACASLRQGECDMAVAGGVSLLLNPGLHAEFDRMGGMSKDGRCRAFSADADGTGWAEGVAVVVLKRLSDARRDNDEIHGVIRGTAVNHDGRSASLTTPSGLAQQRLVRRALSVAGLAPGDVDYIEAHGTGTRLGDPIEAAALAEVFGASRGQDQRQEGSAARHGETLWVGSAKSNIGHTQAAAGLVGLIKVVLSMKHRRLPATLHVSEPTPAMDWAGANMMPVMKSRAWLGRGPRRAGVSAFGIGGTNAHVIVEECAEGEAEAVIEEDNEVMLPFLLSAETEGALRRQAGKLHRHLTQEKARLRDVAYSLATTRTHFRKRLSIVSKNKAGLLDRLASLSQPNSVLPRSDMPPKVAMLFTGQGSQWTGMGRDLSEAHPVFREALLEISAAFHLETPLLSVMWAEEGSDLAALLDRTDFAQPALFALGVALWRLWQSWGVEPHVVVGHSLGEIVAAHAVGVFDLPDACRLVSARARLMQAQSGDVQMVSVGAGSEEVQAVISHLGVDGSVAVALYNSPTQTVVSGLRDAVRAVVDHFSELGVRAKTIVEGHAFHSRQMDGILDQFRAVAETIHYRLPRIDVVSGVNGELAGDRLARAEYWVEQIRAPVRFSTAMQTLAEQGVDVFVEIGARPVLCGLGVECLGHDLADQLAWLPSMSKQDVDVMPRSISRLHDRGVKVNWQAYFGDLGCRRTKLPTYAFQRDFVYAETTCLESTDTQEPPQEHEGLEFEIEWCPSEIQTRVSGGTWGVLPSSHPSRWRHDVMQAMSDAGARLVEIPSINDARDMQGLICLWDPDVNVMEQAKTVVVSALEQLQTAAQLQTVPLVWITCSAVGTGSDLDEGMNLGASPLWGLMRTARSEHPELRLRIVDVPVDVSGTNCLAALVQDEPECAIRGDRILVPRMKRTPLETEMDKPLLRDGAVLITGGLGHVGMRVATWLASEHGVRDMTLTSRRGVSVPGASEFVTQLREKGVRVNVVAGDVADPEYITRLMADFGPDRPLRGVVHAAGIADSGVLSSMTPEQCLNTLAPKAAGAWLLHEATRHLDLDIFVMLSSISGVLGMPGLANYAAANTFLDALAHFRRAQGLPGTSVAFGTWAGEGMASRLGASAVSHLDAFGLAALAPEQGLRLLGSSVLSSRALTVAAALNLERLKGYFESQGGIPPLLDSLLAHKSSDVAHSWSLAQALSDAPPRDHPEIVLSAVRDVVSKTLGFAHPHDVDVDRPLQDIGIDSLTAVQMRNRLATLTGLALSVSITFLQPTLRALSQALLSQLREASVPSSSMSSSGETTATSVDGDGGVRLDMAAIQDGCLDAGLSFPKATGSVEPPRAVFLTGATGFVGASILHELLKQGIATYCLVRASDDTARQRLVDTLAQYSLWDPAFSPLLHPVVGDLSRPLLGLDDDVFDQLAAQVDTICHSGGLVDWMSPLADYIGPNIVSTHEILRLASRGAPKTVHLISTISTLPRHMGMHLSPGDLEHGYATSKYAAERLVAAARWRGLAACVHRLPYVTASASTGCFRRDRGDFLHNLVAGSLEMGAFPAIDADMAAVLPVDYLARTVVSIMTHDQGRIGRDYDFLHAHAPSCVDVFAMLCEMSKRGEVVPFDEWKQRALAYGAAHPGCALNRISAVFEGYEERTAAAMFKGSLVGEHVLGGDVYPAPPLDDNFFRAYLHRISTSSFHQG